MKSSGDGYGEYSVFYDALHGSRAARIGRVQALLDAHAPKSRSVLELACGTGSILAGLHHGYEKTGLDNSPAMLRIARTKLPDAQFVEGDMANFRLGKTFDAIFCTFNSMDHLPDFAAWERVFARAALHLATNGVFLFDTNTISRLRTLAAHQTWSVPLATGGQVVSTVQALPHDVFSWHIQRIMDNGKSAESQEVRLRTYPPDQIATALGQCLQIVDVQTAPGEPVWHEDAGRAYYICRQSRPIAA
jgi:SAM-dependent methyltransferase